jgi:hypothetical protein
VIVGDGFLSPSYDLQRVRPPHAQIGDFRIRLRFVGEQPRIDVDHRCVVAKADTGRSIKFEIVAMVRIVRQQAVDLRTG